MRKDILSVLDVFREKGYACGYLTTNGTIISDERADALAELARLGFLTHVSVSIDGPGELHDKARGVKGTFERTAAGLRRLQAARTPARPVAREHQHDGGRREPGHARPDGGRGRGARRRCHRAQSPDVRDARRTRRDPASHRRNGSRASSRRSSRPIRASRPARVREQVAALERKCRERGMLFDYRPRCTRRSSSATTRPAPPWPAGASIRFSTHACRSAARSSSAPSSASRSATSRTSTLEEVWNSPRYVDLRHRLLENRLFPVCRRCCKVELAPQPIPGAAADAMREAASLGAGSLESEPAALQP